MYDIRQFRPAMYLLIALGFTGFAIAAESMALWALPMGLLLLNGWLVRSGRFTPLPRWVANVGTILSLLYVGQKLLTAGRSDQVLIISEFLVLLQLVKIYEQRSNRDYAQMLILSLLLMVASAISTASLVYGLLFIVYLFLSLYCCLLFHLKVESEQARDALARMQRGDISPAILRQDARFLGRSIRKLTALVSLSAISTAVVVFLFFPRGSGGNLIGSMQSRSGDTLTGFSDQVSFEQVARITQSNEEVAKVTVQHNGQAVPGTEFLYLRGNTLDVYGGASKDSAAGAWRWVRSASRTTQPEIAVQQGQRVRLGSMERYNAQEQWTQQIRLKPTGSRVIFAMAGPFVFAPKRDVNLIYSPTDQVIQLKDPIERDIEYDVVSDGEIAEYRVDNDASGDTPPAPVPARSQSVIDDRIRAYARRPEVSGVDPATRRPLAEERALVRGPQPSPLDEQIAENIARHLQNTFTYTLDLTDAARIIKGQDPLVAFLYDLKRGHCEYFAGAMALMCQSLNLQARVVVGFKCDEYNSLGHYYQVRQSHAHAWVEVLTAGGRWMTFDPTSSRDARIVARTGFLSRMKEFFGFLEFKWAEKVVAYDNDARESLIQNVESRMSGTANRTNDTLSSARQWFSDAANYLSLGVQILAFIIAGAVFIGLGAIAYFLVERWRLRRRAARIGLESLPPTDQLRLARQLKFYADLMSLLHRRNIIRLRHQTPLEFAESLAFLPSDSYRAIHDLTRAFYRVRFGRKELPPEDQRELSGLVSELDARLPIWTGGR